MTLVSATPATRAPTVTPTPSTARPSAPAPLGTRGQPAARTWTSARWVGMGSGHRREPGVCWKWTLLSEGSRSGGEAGRSRTVPEAGGPGAAPHMLHRPPGANPCEHKGKCINTLGSFECQCLQGYAGPRCEVDVNECVSNPCQNDATCLDQIGEFQCICMPGACARLGKLSQGRPPLGGSPASMPTGPQPRPAPGDAEGGQAHRAMAEGGAGPGTPSGLLG